MSNCHRILLTLLALLLLLPLHAQDSDSTRIFNREHPLVYEDAWDLWPYSFLNAEGKPVGYNIDLVKLICDELGIPYVIRLKPTQAALQDVKNGEADLMLAMAANYPSEYGKVGKSVHSNERIDVNGTAVVNKDGIIFIGEDDVGGTC